jgi:hypothetical protein
VGPSFQPGMPPMYLPGTIPPEKVEYVSREMLTKVLDLRDKPKGDAVVVADLPKEHFYVAVLLEVIEPTDMEFQQAYARSAMEGDELLRSQELERRAEYRKEFIAQLRADAKLKVNPDQKERRSESSDTEE